jgi:hypothetical protein
MVRVQWFPTARRPLAGVHAVVQGDLLTLCGQPRAPHAEEPVELRPGLTLCQECREIAYELKDALRAVDDA